MTKDDVKNEYFEWLYDLVCKNRYSEDISFRKLLMFLHCTEFTYIVPMDENRAVDGIALRWQYVCEKDYPNYTLDDLEGPCSILEMMIALTFKCDGFMDDPDMGDRFGQWFWHMIVSLGLGPMDDRSFNKRKATGIINRFLDRHYEPNGKGGLFTIRNCDRDLRYVEIWHQMCWYLDEYY
jgi:hypothetical protein